MLYVMMPPRSLFLAISALCWSAVESCGVLVHNEVLHRSTHLFALPNSTPDLTSLTPLISPLLTSTLHAPSFQAGAFFPDWGYQCLSTDDSAEAAHWPPFLVASVEHIISKYGHLNDTHTRSPEEQTHLEDLIAFIFAVAGHQTSDATWHAIRLPSGFLAALTAIDFAGDIAKAHRVLDFGGDFLLATRLARMEPSSRSWIGDEWKVPILDLIAIYERIGRDVNSYVLRYCTMRGLAALRSDLAVGPSLFDSFAVQSPMLLSSIDDYHLGGIDEMAARTVSCWSNLTRWFAHGIDRDEKLRDGWGICDVFQAIKARGGAGDSSTTTRKPNIWSEPTILQRSKTEFSRITVKTDAFGAETYSLPPLPPSSPPPPREVLQNTKFNPPTYVATYVPYSHFGASITYGNFTLSGPGIAVGAPQETEDSARPAEGNVYVLPLSDLTGRTQSTSFTPLGMSVGPSTDQRFGAASAALNTLGTTMLAVAAPGPYTYDSRTPPSLPFQGTGSAGRIDLFRPGEGRRVLGIRIKGAEMGSIGRRWWGGGMVSVDLDGSGDFLVVSGSWSDGSRVCEGREKVQFGEGEVGVFQFGKVGGGGEVEVEMEVGGRYEEGGVSVRSWAVTVPGKGTPCAKTDTYEYFGRGLGFVASSRTLLVGAPGAEGGRVYGYRFLEGGFVNVFTITSEVMGLRTGFGEGVVGGTTGGREWVVVGAPDEDVDGVVQAGVVRVYVLDYEGGVVARLVAEVVAVERMRYGKFGRKLVADGDGVWVGSEFWDGERGAVWWVDVASVVGGLGKREQVVLGGGMGRLEVEVELKGEEPNARFGTALAVGGQGELFVGIPYSGVAREEQELRFYGAVAVFTRK